MLSIISFFLLLWLRRKSITRFQQMKDGTKTKLKKAEDQINELNGKLDEGYKNIKAQDLLSDPELCSEELKNEIKTFK